MLHLIILISHKEELLRNTAIILRQNKNLHTALSSATSGYDIILKSPN